MCPSSKQPSHIAKGHDRSSKALCFVFKFDPDHFLALPCQAIRESVLDFYPREPKIGACHSFKKVDHLAFAGRAEAKEVEFVVDGLLVWQSCECHRRTLSLYEKESKKNFVCLIFNRTRDKRVATIKSLWRGHCAEREDAAGGGRPPAKRASAKNRARGCGGSSGPRQKHQSLNERDY